MLHAGVRLRLLMRMDVGTTPHTRGPPPFVLASLMV
jgi:hypothetical protein